VIGVHRDGGFSEYMTAPAATLIRFPRTYQRHRQRLSSRLPSQLK
jgi:D-arabinose 1-dehydrogenase-like Zn-dependent alcohol dehydrogenase